MLLCPLPYLRFDQIYTHLIALAVTSFLADFDCDVLSRTLSPLHIASSPSSLMAMLSGKACLNVSILRL